MDKIIVKGAREHNLKNIDLEIPKNKLVVFTACRNRANHLWLLTLFMPRGAKTPMLKSSSYARQFLGIMKKPGCGSDRGTFSGNFYRSKIRQP